MKKPLKPTVAFLTHDWSWGTEPLQPNGCAWYRCVLPSHELNKRGWSSTVGFPGFNSQRGFGLLIDGDRAVHGWNIVVFKLLMQKEVLQSIPIAQSRGQKIVVDVDDWFDGLAKSNMAHAATDPKNNPNSNREIYKEIILAADAVITSTPFLKDYYSKLRKNVFMVRNGIDLRRWKPRNLNTSKKIKIGWVGATHWRSNDLEQLSSFFGSYINLRKILFKHSGHVNHAPKASKLLNINEKLVKTSPLVPILDYPTSFKDIDVGIVPLNNIEFNYAKSFIKGLEYAAAGIPFVSSYSPEYKYLADNGIGRVAQTPNEWIYHLDELLDFSMRRDEVRENHLLLSNFSMDKRGEDWDATMRSILCTNNK
jgi:hypothetical protein